MFFRRAFCMVRQFVAGTVGICMILIGIPLTPMPIPLGVPLIVLGLIILSTEFETARRWVGMLERRTGKVGVILKAVRKKLSPGSVDDDDDDENSDGSNTPAPGGVGFVQASPDGQPFNSPAGAPSSTESSRDAERTDDLPNRDRQGHDGVHHHHPRQVAPADG
jgi:hypothetical protein